MTRDDMIRMAREAGWEYADNDRGFEPLWDFAALVVTAEREACAKVCERLWYEWLDSPEENESNKPDAEDCYKAIRARGENK